MGGSYQCHIKLPSDINKIIVSFDSIGVPGIQFLEQSSNPISDGDSHLEIYVNYDGLFVRGIHLLSRDLSSKYRVWNSPFPPTIHSWNFYHHPWNFEHAQDKPRLDYVKFDSYTQGLILRTSLGRTITSGPQFPTHLINYHEYYPLVGDGDGPISGIFHNGLDPASNFISELGATCMVPPGRGSPTCTWYLTKASLKDPIKAQVCRDKEHGQHIESLGQVRWDCDLTQKVLSLHTWKADIWSDIDYSRLNVQRLPENGIIVWWFSKFDDRIITYYN
ncbi:hypothetical protein BDV30DRAFT_249204 [Aspergillus minisclerotigenes]|uniref:Uncharacterized protein n=1 Tax=Aspergillus minisclerotigenes TaxID=656917 RepID=A0A5N6J3Y6_9EURO|nr:hypothetical protein BDV30DRAFT_249204 [Aspergillus minisclerotigenes]